MKRAAFKSDKERRNADCASFLSDLNLQALYDLYQQLWLTLTPLIHQRQIYIDLILPTARKYSQIQLF